MKSRLGNFLMEIGVLLILSAFLLTVYNIWESKKAEEASGRILGQLKDEIDGQKDSEKESENPLYKLYPDMEMPVIEIDGTNYIGILEIPFLNLQLPVASEWNYPNLRSSPCRYKGSAYQDNMIIAGHNYNQHFGGLKNLKIGEAVCFTDLDGNRFEFKVADIESIPGTAVEDMEAGEWDMTLFTCTYGGKSRVTIRCRRSESF